MSPDEAAQIALNSFEDPAFFMRTFLPRWFSLPMPWVHRGMLAVLCRQTDWLLKFGEEEWPGGVGTWDQKQLEKIIKHFTWKSEPGDPHSPMLPIFEPVKTLRGKIIGLNLLISDKMLFIMPRGVSKTTLVNGHVLREIARHEAEFVVYLSEAATHAEAQLMNVRREIEGNETYCKVFGEKKPERSDPEKWTDKLLQTNDGMVVAAKGRGGQVRGMNIDGKRPSDIIFDDVEDKDSVKTTEQRKKTLDWLRGDVEQALPQIGERRGRLLGMGTILHAEALLPTLSNNPEWLTIVFGAKDPDGEMLWSHYLTEQGYEKKRKSFIKTGQIHIFNMEYNSSIRGDDSNAKFKQEYMKYATYDPAAFPGRAIVIDPAISDKKDSDYVAYAVVGMSPKGRIHVFEIFMERGMHPKEQVDKYFELHFKWDCNKHGVEAVAYQKALVHLLQEEMHRRSKLMGPRAYFEINPILHGKTGKRERVEGVLATRMAAGYVTFERIFPEFEGQLLDWPNGKKDGPDVVAMAIQELDPYAAFAFDDGDELGLEKDHYKPLEEELGGEWRTAP